MSAHVTFGWHMHEEHQLVWAPSGVLTVLTSQDDGRYATWVLPPSRALWIPAGLSHETGAVGLATMRSVYVRPGLSPVDWTRPTAVSASPLLAELIGYLGGSLAVLARQRAEALLADLLTPVPLTTIDVRLPPGGPARSVADQLLADPADKRTLREWGRAVGASERTLAHAFLAGTGLPFGRWRLLLRLQLALPMLAAGEAVGVVARRVGYDRDSAFAAAFRSYTGITPAACFR